MAMRIDAGDLEQKLQRAAEAERHFQRLLLSHAWRLRGSDSCFTRFRSSVEVLREHPTGPALAAVDECHNELCVLQDLLESENHPFCLVEYEPQLPQGDHRIDFRTTNDMATWFIEVKTIHPELKDR